MAEIERRASTGLDAIIEAIEGVIKRAETCLEGETPPLTEDGEAFNRKVHQLDVMKTKLAEVKAMRASFGYQSEP